MQEINRNNSIIKKKILQYADFKGITAYKIYQETGITNGIFSKFSGISEDNLIKFVRKYSDINLNWLLLDDGPMIKPDESEAIDNHVKRNQDMLKTHDYPMEVTDLIKVASFVTDQNKKLEKENIELKNRLNALSKKYKLPESTLDIAAEPDQE